MVIGVNDQIHIPEGHLSFDLPFADQKAFLAASGTRRMPDYPTAKELFFFLDFPEGDVGSLAAPSTLRGRSCQRID